MRRSSVGGILQMQLFAEGAAMQVNENAGQVQKVKRIPDVDGAELAKKVMPETLDDGPRPVATKKPEVAVEPKRHSRRYGAGF